MKLGVHHIALEAADFEKTLAFYMDGLGCKMVRSWGDERKTAMLDIGDGTILEVFSSGNYDESVNPKYPHLALRTDNCDEAYAAAIQAGATTQMEPKDMVLAGTLPVKIAFVKGLSGEVIEFFEEK